MTHTHTPINVWGIVPAAGMSRRMGRAKQALPFKNSTVAATVAGTMLAAGVDGVVVVTRSELTAAMSLPNDDRLTVAYNDDPRTEMIDSIRLALAHFEQRADFTATRGSEDGVLVIPGDMPAVAAGACRLVIEAFRKDPRRIVIATHQGRRGHPIVFPIAMRPTLDAIEGGLNELPRRHADLVTELNVADPATLHDIDTEADYESLRQ